MVMVNSDVPVCKGCIHGVSIVRAMPVAG